MRQLVQSRVLSFLVPNVRAYYRFVSAHYRYKVAPRLEVLTEEVTLALPIHPRQVEGALALFRSLRRQSSSGQPVRDSSHRADQFPAAHFQERIMSSAMWLLLAVGLTDQVLAQTNTALALSGRDQQLADPLNLQLGREIVVLPRGDYESQMAVIRMIPGFRGELGKLRSMVEVLTAQLAEQKNSLAHLLAENEALRQQFTPSTRARRNMSGSRANS